jgi:FAD/FMN-containing dehydrogenase
VLNILQENLSASIIQTDEDILLEYGRDWTRYHQPNPTAILFPRTTEEVQEIVLLANEYGFVLVPSGGRTGLSAGAVANNKEVVVSLDKMNKILDFNELDQTITAEAGIITQEVQEYAKEKGLIFPVNFASEGSSRIGGNIATNAGGIKVVKYGMFRDWVTGLKVVTGKGDILELNQGLIKNATGYDLRHLFIGSEGTLGFVVEATLKLTRPAKEKQVILFGVPDMKCVVKVMNAFRQKIDFLAFEFFSDNTVDYVIDHTNVIPPLPQRYPYYTIIEFESNNDENTNLVFNLYRELYQKEWILDDAFSADENTMKRLWSYRENISSSISSFTPYKNDLSVRISNISNFLNEIEIIVKNNYPNFVTLWYGHIADGNLHLNIIKPKELNISDFENKCKKVNDLIFPIVQKYKGSISAEHGVGLLKKPYLNYSRSATEINYLRMIKNVFDPNNIMNRGKLIGE